MDDIRITYHEMLYGAIGLNILLGAMFGSLPLLAGLLLRQRRLAWISFVLAVVGGGLLGVFLAFPVSLIFLWLILREVKSEMPPKPDTGTSARDETPSEPTDAE